MFGSLQCCPLGERMSEKVNALSAHDFMPKGAEQLYVVW